MKRTTCATRCVRICVAVAVAIEAVVIVLLAATIAMAIVKGTSMVGKTMRRMARKECAAPVTAVEGICNQESAGKSVIGFPRILKFNPKLEQLCNT